MAEQVPFVLSYDKTYPPCDVRGHQFAMARSKAHEHLHKLSPMLDDTLVHLALMPYRAWATPEEVKAAVPGVDRLLIKATERASHRATDEAKHREHSRGKKQPTLKNTVMVLPDQFIVFLGRTLSGHHHDYLRLKQALPPAVAWCTASNMRVD